MSDLAIIIPAYKESFLEKALESLTNQTCQDFQVYVGDDASPYDIKKIVTKFRDRLHITYFRFPENIGGNDLVRHWERCISLSKEESWIWLFSDDDELEPHCVELFYQEISKLPLYDLYHFNVNIINEQGIVIHESRFPEMISSFNFLRDKLRGKLSSFVVEYIFSRQCYLNCGGFQKFDLAWGSDDATWVKFGKRKGIKTIDGAFVRWRKSNINISPNNYDWEIVHRKIASNLAFIEWANEYLENSFWIGLSLKMSEMTWFCTNIAHYSQVLSKSESDYYIKKICNLFRMPYLFYMAKIYLKFK